MAGRGRGRGRGLSINIEALGLGRGEVVPTIAQPPPLYPPLIFRGGLPARSAELDYMVALRQEMRYSLIKSPFYVSAPNKTKDIDRYSDKYSVGANEGLQRWEPEWSMFPSELQERKRKRLKPHSVKPNLKTSRKTKVPEISVSDVLEKLEKVDENPEALEEEENEVDDVDEGNKKEKTGDDEDEEEEEYDEEDLEEETDYNLAYFDNGEGYGDEDDDDDEGPTY